MKQANNERVLLQFRESEYENAIAPLYSGLSIINNLSENYKSFGFGVMSNDDLIRAIEDPEGLIFDKITKGNPITINGLEIHKSKAIELIKKPIGYDSFIADLKGAIESFKSIKVFNSPIQATQIKEYYELDSNGKAFIKEVKLQKIKSSFEVYTENAVSKQVYDLAKTIIEACSTPELNYISKSKGFTDFITNLFEEFNGGNIVKINIDTIKHYNHSPNKAR